MERKRNNRTYYFFIGTDAELIKLLPVIKEFESRKVSYKIIASGQNNIQESDLFNLLQKKGPDIVLFQGNIKQTPLGLFGWFFVTLVKSVFLLRKEFKNSRKRKIRLIIHGDTVSTVMGALLGRIFRLELAHVEAGLRSFNYFHPFPEEIDRIISSHFVSIHFCPNQWAVDNLKKKKGVKINTVHNTLLDSLNLVISKPVHLPMQEKLKGKKYFIFIMHRQENLLNDTLVETLIAEVIRNAKTMTCVFVMHKPTLHVLEKKGLLKKLQAQKNILLSERLSYISFMKLMQNTEYIITDGGSNQEESYYFGKPSLILRSATERIEGLGENVVLSKNNLQTIRAFLKNPLVYKTKRIIAKIKPSKIIVDYLVNTDRVIDTHAKHL